ncbi:hypothetical protein OAJ52_02305 [Bacteroidia bacterium]|jgi:hypothetical protein|nr:hypothetical protein [Bacteroidia bacterium]MDC0104789.1 hypothetical protein [Bacteroidia bacterium]|tara:strand:+ start:218 stop:793 length:576 start_codon:yes stop_codon:yes gene_type:complete
MKKSVFSKFKILCLGSVMILSSCKKENIDKTITVFPDQTASVKLIGKWEAYKLEKHELQLDSIVGNPPKAFSSMVWFDQTSSRVNEGTMEFNADYTFQNFYAEVLVYSGTWNQVNDSTFTMNFDPNGTGEWSDITTDYILTKHCDNTISVDYLVAPPAGNHEHQDADWQIVTYFRTPGTVECDDLIDYYVE